MVSETTLRARAARARMVLTDCDGVLTDGGVYYSGRGELLRRFSVRDGMGVERLRRQGIATGIVSGERSPAIQRRAEKLGIEVLHLGVRDKLADLAAILAETGLEAGEVAYIGDDVNDRELLAHVGAHGLTGAPADAEPEVRSVVQRICARRGGEGAFREFAEWVLELRGRVQPLAAVGADRMDGARGRRGRRGGEQE